jgi:hypothetical protein
VGEERVTIREIRIGVERDSGHLVRAVKGPLVQCLDVLQDVDELQIGIADLPRRQGVEHERVIRVRTMGHRDSLRHVTLG